MEELDRDHVLKLSLQKLMLAAEYYSNVCPGIARYYTKEIQWKLQSLTGVQESPNTKTCRHCGTIFRLGNHSIRFLGKLKQTKQLRKSWKCIRNRKSLKRKLLDMVEAAGSRIAVTCTFCKKRSLKVCSDPEFKRRKVAEHSQLVAAEEKKPLNKKQKKRLKEKERKRQTAHEKAGIVLPSSSGPNAFGLSPTLCGQQETKKKLAITSQAKHRSLQEVLRTSRTMPSSVQAKQVKNSAKKRMSALEKLLSKEQNMKKEKTSGTGLAGFLSSL